MMKKILLFLLSIQAFTLNSQCIETLGPDDFNQASLTQSLHTDIAIDNNNTPYITYAYYSTISQPVCIVKKYVNNHWNQVGDPIPASVYGNQIKIGNDGLPIVCFSDGSKIYTYKFNGAAWFAIGTPITQMVSNSDFSMEIDNTNMPCIAYNDNVISKISVLRFNGASWGNIGLPGISNGIGKNSITFDNSGNPYIAYNNGNDIAVKRFDGSNWLAVGGSFISLPIPYSSYSAYKLKLKFNYSGVLYLAYQNPTGVLLKFNGTSWVQEGGFFFNNCVDALDLDFDTTGKIFVSFEQSSTNHKAGIATYDGVSWTSQILSSGFARYTSLTTNTLGVPYLICKDDGNMEKATVRRLNGSMWEIVGAAGFSDGPVSYGPYGSFPTASMATYKNGQTYIAFAEEGNGIRTLVKKYDGINWNIVGNSPINSTVTTRNQLVIDNNGTPYLLYEDRNTYPTVVKFDGTSWITVGNSNIANSSLSSIAINPITNMPYIVFGDYINGQKASVMKFDGSNWVYVGIPAFSNEKIDYTSISLDPSGTPYVAFRDNVNQGYVGVMKYNGTTWSYVGSPLYVSSATDLEIKINSSGRIFLVCGSAGINVYEYIGSSWQNIGFPNYASSNFGGIIDMSFDKTGMPVLAFPKTIPMFTSGGGISVVRYNGNNNWDLIIKREFSASNITNPLISADTIGNIYVAYASDRLYAKRIIPGPSVSILASADSICSGETAILTATGSANYIWNTGSTNSSISIAPTTTTLYSVQAEAGGCISYDTKSIIVNSCVGIKEENMNNTINIFPNPTSGILHISESKEQHINRKIEIITIVGQTVLIEEFANKVDVSNLPEGIYTLKILTFDGHEFYSKFIKQ